MRRSLPRLDVHIRQMSTPLMLSEVEVPQLLFRKFAGWR